MCWKCEYMKKYNKTLSTQSDEAYYKQKIVESIIDVCAEVIRTRRYLDSDSIISEKLQDNVNLLLTYSLEILDECKNIQFKAKQNAKYMWKIQTADSKEEFEAEELIIY